MIPSLTEKAAHVTMLQRTPSYIMSSAARVNPCVERDPESPAAQGFPLDHPHGALRSYGSLLWLVARRAPGSASVCFGGVAEKNLPAGL